MRLKELRNKKKLYQKDVAKYLGVDRTTYNKYEAGTSEPSIMILDKLCELYDVSFDYLIGRTDTPTNEKPATLTDDGLRNDIMDLYDSLPADQQAQALSYLRFLSSQKAP